MKKYILVVTLFFLASCWASTSEIEQAKKELFQTGGTSPEITQTSTWDISSEEIEEDMVEESINPSLVEIIPLTESQFIEVTPIAESDVNDWEIQISGKTLEKVEKIEVSFSNATSDYPNDNYTLQTFTSWDRAFKYNASSMLQVLDYGKNTYIIKAYTTADNYSETEVSIIVPTKPSVIEGSQQQVIGTEDDSVILNLPVSAEYGNPISLGVNSITYSNINGFEIVKKDVSGVTCEGLTEYLQDSINTWFYWNTCRDIVKDKGISFYVIRLDGETYIYQKHYVDFEHSFSATYDIETGTGVDSNTIAEKNTELKDINDTFEKVSMVDGLMRKLVNQN